MTQIYPTKICPQRVLHEAIRLLEKLNTESWEEDEKENLDNNLQELENLIKRLHNAGITMI